MRMFDKLTFSGRIGRLSSRDAEYWRVLFNKIIKVGEEFEVQMPGGLSRSRVFNTFRSVFQPTKNVDDLGSFILDVTEDGSVPNGMELITVGRRFNWRNFHEMNASIMNEFNKHDFYTSYHTGMHIHILAGYSSMGVRDLERPMPEIILANLYQLHRIFAPELFWIASGGASRDSLTRYILFRRPPFDFSPMTMSMRDIVMRMREKYGKYQMFNMNHVEWSNNTEITRFHYEVRHPDTHLSASYATALVALEVALLYKAIEISQCGLINMKQDEFDMRREMFDKFANLGTGDRDSDSTDLTDEDISQLGQMTLQMVRWFKAEILSQSHTAYEILKTIAVTPASVMRVAGHNWRDIERIITPSEPASSYTPDMLGTVSKIIFLQQVSGCKNIEEWKQTVSKVSNVNGKLLTEILREIRRDRVLVWDQEIGSPIYK